MKKIFISLTLCFMIAPVQGKTAIAECNEFLNTLTLIEERLSEIATEKNPLPTYLEPQVWADFREKVIDRVANKEMDAAECSEKNREHQRFLAELLK